MAVKTRIFAGFGVVLFLITSSFLTIAVILTLIQNNSSTATNPSTTTQPTTSGPLANPASTTNTDGSKLQGFTPLTSPVSHLEITNITNGNGSTVTANSTITANYVGALADTGVIFDSSGAHGGPQTFSLSGVIEGWKLGLTGMKVGGTREIIIPAGLGYGSQGTQGIPPNSDLVFIVNVVKLN